MENNHRLRARADREIMKLFLGCCGILLSVFLFIFMKEVFLFLVGCVEMYVIFILPIQVSYKLCKKRGRNTAKGIVVTLLTGWLGTLIIWLFLTDKSRA